MSNVNQKTDVGQPFCDLSFKNYGVADIAADAGVLLDATLANVDGIVLPSNGGGVAGSIGVTVEIIPAGKYGRVRVYGISVMTADGAITRGNYVQIDDTAGHLGQAKAAPGAGVEHIGMALDTCADTETVRVLHIHGKNT